MPKGRFRAGSGVDARRSARFADGCMSCLDEHGNLQGFERQKLP